MSDSDTGGIAESIAYVAQIRADMWRNGFRPVPVHNFNADLPEKLRGKKPFGGEGWQLRAAADPPEAVVLVPDRHALNTGMLTAGLRAIDIDVADPDLAETVVVLAEQRYGPTIRRTRNNSGKTLLVYRAADGMPPKRWISGAHGKLEVLGCGQQCVAHGIHYTGALLLWQRGAPHETPIEQLPAVDEAAILTFLAECAPLIGGSDIQTTEMVTKSTSRSHTPRQATLELDDVVAALAVIPNNRLDWDFWFEIAAATHAATGGSEAGHQAFLDWSRRCAGHDDRTTRRKWSDLGRNPVTRITAGTLIYQARKNDPEFLSPSVAGRLDPHAAVRAKICKLRGQDVAGSLSRLAQRMERGRRQTARALKNLSLPKEI